MANRCGTVLMSVQSWQTRFKELLFWIGLQWVMYLYALSLHVCNIGYMPTMQQTIFDGYFKLKVCGITQNIIIPGIASIWIYWIWRHTPPVGWLRLAAAITRGPYKHRIKDVYAMRTAICIYILLTLSYNWGWFNWWNLSLWSLVHMPLDFAASTYCSLGLAGLFRGSLLWCGNLWFQQIGNESNLPNKTNPLSKFISAAEVQLM